MAIIIPKSKIFDTPNIKLIPENVIEEIDYTQRKIDNDFSYHKLYSGNVTCWGNDDLNSNNYFFKGSQSTQIEEGNFIIYYNGDYLYFSCIRLPQEVKDVFFEKTPYVRDKEAYIEITYNYATNVTTNHDEFDDRFGISKSSVTKKSDSDKCLCTSSLDRGKTKTYVITSFPQTASSIYLQCTSIGFFKPTFKWDAPSNQNTYCDYVNGYLIFFVGRLSSISGGEANGNIIFDFSFNFYYPSYSTSETNATIGTSTYRKFDMKTNTFMNDKGNSTHVYQKANNIYQAYNLGKIVANLSCAYGQYKNDDGTIAYSGTDGKFIKVGDIVQLAIENINLNFQVTKSEIVYDGETRVNLSIEQYEIVYGISENASSGATLTYTRMSSTQGASTGAINKYTKLYAGDVVKIDLSYSSATHRLNSFVVNGSSFTSGNTITISNDLNVFVDLTSLLGIIETLSSGVSMTYARTSSTRGGSIGTITSNDTIYVGDVIQISASYDTNVYNLNSFEINGIAFTSGNSLTVESNLYINVSTSVKTFTITRNVDSNSYLTIYRHESPYGGGSIGVVQAGDTIYYNDKLLFDFGANSGYDLQTHTINGSTLDGSTYYRAKQNLSVVISSVERVQSWHTITSSMMQLRIGDGETPSSELRTRYIDVSGLRANCKTRIKFTDIGTRTRINGSSYPIDINDANIEITLNEHNTSDYVIEFDIDVENNQITYQYNSETSGNKWFKVYSPNENGILKVEDKGYYEDSSNYSHFTSVIIRKIEQYY